MSDPYGVVTGEPIRRSRGRRRRVWLQGGSSTQPWGADLIAWAVVALGVGLVIAASAPAYNAALWLVMLVPVVVAFLRSVPRGLMRWRATDLLFGVVLGVALRLVTGWLERGAQGPLPWPSYDTSHATWWLGDVIAPVMVAPLVEEFFFHGLLLIALYTVLRRATGAYLLAGIAAALLTTGAFVLTHLATGALADNWAGPVSIAVVGMTGAVLVLATGRIWGAVLMHLVFNGSLVGLGIVGTLLGSGGAGLS